MQYALYSIPDGYFLDHSRSSLLRTVEAKEAYANPHNVVVIGYERRGTRLEYVAEYTRKRVAKKPAADKEAVQDALTWLSKIKR